MSKTLPAKQTGFSFVAFLFGTGALILAVVTGMKLIPAYIDDAAIKSVLVTIARDPDMQKASMRDIRLSFDKRAGINNIRVIKSADLQIEKVGDVWELSASYTVLIPLAGNVSWYLEFNPSSEQ